MKDSLKHIWLLCVLLLVSLLCSGLYYRELVRQTIQRIQGAIMRIGREIYQYGF